MLCATMLTRGASSAEMALARSAARGHRGRGVHLERVDTRAQPGEPWLHALEVGALHGAALELVEAEDAVREHHWVLEACGAFPDGLEEGAAVVFATRPTE